MNNSKLITYLYIHVLSTAKKHKYYIPINT